MAGNFSLQHRVLTGSGAPRPPVPRVRGALSLGLGRPGRGAGHSPLSGAGFGRSWKYTSPPNTPSWPGGHLKHIDNCTFTFTFYLLILENCC